LLAGRREKHEILKKRQKEEKEGFFS